VRYVYEVDGAMAEVAKLYVSRNNTLAPTPLVPIPAKTLVIRDLIEGETVTFPFDTLSPVVRRQLSTCVPAPAK
jgi:hypothetical protein